MNRNKILEIIDALEVKYPVQDWVMRGLHIWPFIKVNIFFSAFLPGTKNTVPTTSSVNHFVASKLTNFKNRIRLNTDKRSWAKKSQHQYDVVFLAYPAHRIQLKGKWYNRFFDGFIDYLSKTGRKGLLLEAFQKQPYYAVNYNQDFRLETHLLKEDYVRKHTELFKPISAEEFPENFDAFYEELVFFFGKDTVQGIRKASFGKWLLRFTLTVAYYKTILQAAKPKIGMVLSYFSFDAFAFVAACHELKITCIDLQHGLQSEASVTYNWKAIPAGGYEVLPDIFWNWSGVEAELIGSWAKNTAKHKPLVGGNPWLDVFKRMDADISAQYTQELKKLKIDDSGKIRVLFTLQPLENDPLADWVIQAIAASPANYLWLIRLHPRVINQDEIRKKLSVVPDPSKYEIESSTQLPLPLLLKITSIHLTSSSAVVKEAREFGVPSLFFDETAISSFKEEMNAGIAFHFGEESANALLNKIDTVLSSQTPDLQREEINSIRVFESLLN